MGKTRQGVVEDGRGITPESVCEGFLLKISCGIRLLIMIISSSSSSSHHHHHLIIIIIIIISSSSHHHHLLIIISPSSASSFPSLSFAFLFFSILAQPSSHENVPGATPLRESACRVSKTEGFLRFFNFWSNPLRESGCRVSKTGGFLRVLVCPVHPSQGKRGSSVKNWFFLRFWGARKCPEDCADDSFCLIRPFFRERKNERKSPKNVKNWGFWRFFRVRSNPLRESGCRVSKTGFFLRFWCARICANDSFCFIRPSPNPVPR